MMKYYDSISKGYEELYGEEQLSKAMIVLDNIKPSKKQLLLDVGCGSGAFLELCQCRKIGLDPSLKLLKKSKGFVVQGKAEYLPFKDRCFDFVVSITAIHNFDNVKKAINEIKRVAKSMVIISLLRQSKNFDKIRAELEKSFLVKKIILEKKDAIFVLNNKI